MTTTKRGFASMDPAKQREIASKGGKPRMCEGQRTNGRGKKRARRVARVHRRAEASAGRSRRKHAYPESLTTRAGDV